MFKVQKKACKSCIYRKDSPLDVTALENQALKKDSWRVCHHSEDVCCRGFWNKNKHNFNLGRIMQRLGAVKYVSVDTLGAK